MGLFCLWNISSLLGYSCQTRQVLPCGKNCVCVCVCVFVFVFVFVCVCVSLLQSYL